MWKDVFMLKVLKGFPICEAQSDDARWAFTLFLGGASIMHPGVTIAIGAKRHLPGALGWHGWEQSAELVVIYHWYLSAEMNESWPIGSMYGIYANIGGILMVNVTIYSIHGSYGWWVIRIMWAVLFSDLSWLIYSLMIWNPTSELGQLSTKETKLMEAKKPRTNLWFSSQLLQSVFIHWLHEGSPSSKSWWLWINYYGWFIKHTCYYNMLNMDDHT